MMDLGDLKYFLGLELLRKYALDLLFEETGVSNCEPLKLRIAQNLKLMADSGDYLEDSLLYRRVFSKLIYLNSTRLDLSYGAKLICPNLLQNMWELTIAY